MPISKSMVYKPIAPVDFLLVQGERKQEQNQAMTKSLEVINEAVRNPKQAFRKVDNQPKKEQKHRYERRKIKEYIHLGEWLTPETT